MQGAPVTWHVTSPTSLLSLKMVRVAVIVPLMSVALAEPGHVSAARTIQVEIADVLRFVKVPPFAVKLAHQ
jgi:hypothetical protein